MIWSRSSPESGIRRRTPTVKPLSPVLRSAEFLLSFQPSNIGPAAPSGLRQTLFLLRQFQELEARQLRAGVGDLEIARHRLASELERVRLARLARRHHLDLGH